SASLRLTYPSSTATFTLSLHDALPISDGDARFGVDGDDDLTALRLRLLPPERERLARLGRDAARALEHAVSAWRPGEQDRDVQARVAEELERVGALPVCLIVGGDDRVERFRHPLATGRRVQRLLMAVVVAIREGLHVAPTRVRAGALAAPEPLVRTAHRDRSGRCLEPEPGRRRQVGGHLSRRG